MARLFVAILLPPIVESHLDEHVDAVRGAHPELRWVPASRWHVTLEFLGQCGPHEASRQLDRWARRAKRSHALELRLEGCGTFPKAWMARVLWTAVAGEVADWRRLAAHGQEPHMTIARTRERRDLTGVVDELSSYSGPTFTADRIAVVESHLRGGADRGPRYEPLEFFALGG